MRFRFLWVGKTKDALFASIEENYLKRIGLYFPVERQTIRDLKKSDPRQRVARLQAEAREIEKQLSPHTYLVVLDSVGKQFTSEKFAAMVAKLMNEAVPEVTFLVGGHLGTPAPVRDSADLLVSLGKWTLPHELARIVLLEQVYRAVTIIKGLPYHK